VELGGVRGFRSGDMAYRDGGGWIHYTGRVDNMVKIRGNRVELLQIEEVLSRHPKIEQVCVVKQHHDTTGEDVLTAFVILKEEDGDLKVQSLQGGGLLRIEIKDYVGTNLPLYMVPTYVALLEFFPLTPNGKTDRKSIESMKGWELDTVPFGSSVESSELQMPQNETEAEIRSVWGKLLGIEASQ